MLKSIKVKLVIVISVILTVSTVCRAGDYENRPEALAVIDYVVSQGVDRDWAKEALAAAEKSQAVLDAISFSAEKTKSWHEYRQIFITDRRIRDGVVFAKENASALTAVSLRTGVPREIIVAIIGIETFYGRIQGKHDVIDALSTLAFDYPKRSSFFTSELKHFLLLAWKSGKDPLKITGSYAGAMGYGQFMPSSYFAYAKDFDGDEIADIWNNPADAIYSVANYLLKHGWKPGESVVVRANRNAAETDELIFQGGLKPRLTVGELMARGFAPTKAVDINLKATAMKLEGESAFEYWLGLENFYVITRYNHSAMYALSVWQLSRAIADSLADS